MISLTVHGLKNLIVGIALFCIGPIVLYLFMRNIRGMLLGAGAGLTILFWVGWLSLVKHVAPSKEAENKSDAAKDMKEEDRPNIHISSQNQSSGFTGINTGTVNLRTPPRTMRDDQVTQFSKALKEVPRSKARVIRYAQTQECANLAARIKTLLVGNGFTVGEIDDMMAVGPSPVGVAIGCPDPNHPPDQVAPMQVALATVGIDSAIIKFGPPEDTFSIIVGAQPEP